MNTIRSVANEVIFFSQLEDNGDGGNVVKCINFW